MTMIAELTLPSPIFPISNPLIESKGVRLFVKREDLIHPYLSGNKWRKLKYNIEEARKTGKKTLVTFGGAFSNHLYATAAAGKLFGFNTIGLLRGEIHKPMNPTLKFASECGMKLIPLSRSDYALKAASLSQLDIDLRSSYILPEGGTNTLALKGCAEIVPEIESQLSETIHYLAVACGTGGTAAGMISALRGPTQLLGFSVLKGDFHTATIQQLLEDYQKERYPSGADLSANWHINTDYHFKGYARYTQELIQFINQFYQQHQLALDPVYTSKVFYGLFDLIGKDYFPKGSTIALIHTGGLQGIEGFNQRFGPLIKVA